jgi:hypothetical protein
MSGFEIAGVFLGAVPIIVEALKCYQQSADAFQRWRRYGRDVKILIRNLETERVKMENVCEKLLLGLVPSRQMEEMIGNPFGPSWKDPELWGQIRLRLWNAGKIFEETVQDMKEAIEELMLKLGIESDGKVSSLVFWPSFGYRHRKRC